MQGLFDECSEFEEPRRAILTGLPPSSARRPALSSAASVFGNRSVAHNILIISRSPCPALASRLVRWTPRITVQPNAKVGGRRGHDPPDCIDFRNLKYTLNAKASKPNGHQPFDFIACTIAEQSSAKRRESKFDSPTHLRLQGKRA